MDAERRRAALALVPLAVIAVGLAVPPIVSAPAHVAVISPWQDGWQMFWWVHLAAGVLAVLGAVAVWRRIAPGPVIVSIACVAIAGMLYAPVRLLQFAWHDEHALAALFAAELVAGVALLVLAWRATGWRRWMHLLGAYAALTVHYGCPVVTGMLDAFSGGVTFIAALATLAVLAGSVLSKQTILAFAIGAAGVSVYAASRPRGGPRAGATSPETAVRGALEAAVRGMDPDTFLLDDARCRALYAGDDAPPISELGRASDEASCARGAASLRDALRRLATGGITFELGARTTDRFGRIAFPVTLHSNSHASQLVELCTVPVDGRYFVGAKVDASPPRQSSYATTVAELRHAIASAASAPRTGDLVVIDGEYMRTDHVGQQYRVGLVEDAGAASVTFTVVCVAADPPSDIHPGQRIRATGVLHHPGDTPTLDPCDVSWNP